MPRLSQPITPRARGRRNVLVTVPGCGFDHAARARAEKVIELKDGSTLYLFKDGKMALEDRYGRAARMKLGHVVETKDGQKITMHSDEVMRLNGLLREEHGGGRP